MTFSSYCVASSSIRLLDRIRRALLENAGVPVPGETVLLFASFLAFDEQELRLRYIILVGIAAATIGDNIGYWIGRKGGRPLP